MQQRYNDFNTSLKAQFGCRVQKITIDAGLSCPNRDGTLSTGGCIYCNARGSGTGALAAGMSLTDQIAAARKILAKRYGAKRFIAYFQSFSNTYAPRATLRRLYEEALGPEDIVGLAIGTRPDCIDAPKLDDLEELARTRLVWLEYGLQSAHDATLQAINRGHDFSCFARAVALTRNRGINICAHVILGLPGENRDQMLATARALADQQVDGVKIHLLYVPRGTVLERRFDQGAFQCLGQQDYVGLVCDFLEILPPSMVIQRLTGDPHPGELVAPAWALEKAKTLEMIRSELQRRDTWQGKRWTKSTSVLAD
jgi:radical SAM protein (TIGR01212 family)